MANRLNLSIMSLRDYPADEDGPSKFYLRIRINDGEPIKTEPKTAARGNGLVQFMEHVTIPFRNTGAEVLKFELFQSSPTGDLVLGECKMRVSDIVATGAVHSWFPFVDAADPSLKAGEVLMAIQAKKGAANARSSKAAASVTTSAPFKAPAARRSGGRRGLALPMPLAIACGVLLGALAVGRHKKSVFYEVQEGDTLCTISECYNRDYRDIYLRNRQVIDDPNLIYPGDRIRVR